MREKKHGNSENNRPQGVELHTGSADLPSRGEKDVATWYLPLHSLNNICLVCAFTEKLKANIHRRYTSFRPSFCLNFSPLSLDGFSWNCVFEYFSKIFRETFLLIKTRQVWRTLYTKTNIHLLSYLTKFYLEWKMFQTKVVEKIKTHILCSVTFFRKTYRLWDNVEKIYIVERGRPQMTVWLTRIACWTPKATDTHSECVTLIAFPLQQLLHERAIRLHYTYIECLFIIVKLGPLIYIS